MARHSTKRLCLIVYKIEKDIGSEDGVGYDITCRLLKDYRHVTLISRNNNVEKLKDNPLFSDVEMIGLDVPQSIGWFKRKGRGIILYYYLWQVFVGRLVTKLQKNQQFDLVYQLNFHTDWAPHFLSNHDGKVAWGPIVHHPRVKRDFLVGLSPIRTIKMRIGEWLKQMVKNAFWYLDWNMPKAINNTDTIIYGNPFLAPPFEKARNKVHIFPYGASVFKGFGEALADANYPANFAVLFSGRLIPLKNPAAVIDAFITFAQSNAVDKGDISLTFLGEGPLKDYIVEQCEKANMSDLVQLPGRLPQPTLKEHYANAAVFLFPSVESQSLVTAEAMAFETVPICLDHTGPGFVAQDGGIIVNANDYQQLVSTLTEALLTLYDEWKNDKPAFSARMEKAYHRYQHNLTFDAVYSNIDEAIWS